MSGYKRNQQGQFRNTNQNWRQDEDWRQSLNRKGEDVYGEGENYYQGEEYYGEGYRDPDRTPFPMPYEPERRETQAYGSIERRPESSRGIYKGRGPRGYQRSDHKIWEDISDRLADDSFIDATDIEVTVKDCEVVLSGTVDSKNAKRRAEDISESVSGVKNVENKLRVRRSTDREDISGNPENRIIETQKEERQGGDDVKQYLSRI